MERSGTVSAIAVAPSRQLGSLLAVAGLTESVSIYRMDVELLMMNAPALMHEFASMDK
jgi:F0F1-type ATP synthase membrane subunit c/vacuolar-type H+-ATPase subunit K